jgi:hypothetical protein
MTNQPINDGGPAFPCEEQIRCNGEVCDIRKFTGMTIRDYFAAAALQGLLASIQPNQLWSGDDVAITCYRTADVMLKARECK